MTDRGWSTEERRQVIAAGLSPLLVSLLMTGMVCLYAGDGEALFMLVGLVPAAYATLFFFVLPALCLLRWSGRETLASFAIVCGLATLVPYFVLYVWLFPEGSGEYAGAPFQILAMLALPALLAMIAGAVVHRLGSSRRV